MMNAQGVFNRMQETKAKIKDIKSMLKQAYENVFEYVELSDEIKERNQKRRAVRASVDQQYPEDITHLEDLKIDLASDKELLNDILLSRMMKGEDIELHDNPDREQLLLPIFTAKLVRQK